MTTTLGAYKGIAINPGTDAEVSAQIKSIDANSALPVSSLGSSMNTTGLPTAPNMTSQYNGAVTGAVAGASLPGVTPTPTVPPGWDATTYANFKQANPTLEPTPEDTQKMLNAGKDTTPPETGLSAFFKKYFPNGTTTTKPTSAVDTYKALATENDLTGKQKEVNDLTAQLKTITDSTTSGQLALEGKDVSTTQGIVDRKQAQLARENAIKALPISAALNAAQGRLDTAKSNITTMLGLIAEDNKANYQFEKDQIDYAMTFANADQKDALQKRADDLAAKKAADDRFATLRNAYVNKAMDNGDFATAGKLATATTQDDLNALAGGIKYTPTALEKAQIDNIYSQIEERNKTTGENNDPATIVAYAQQYASNGQIPTGLPKGTFGTVAQVAKELPKANGTIVDNNTGIKSSKLTSAQTDAYSAMKDLTNKITEAQTLFNKLHTGVLGGLLGNIPNMPNLNKSLGDSITIIYRL